MFFGVGGRCCGEVAVGNGLGLDDVDVGESETSQHGGNQLDAGAVERSVDNLDVVALLDAFGVQHVLFDFLHESFVDLGADGDDAALAAVPFDIVERLDFLHFVDDAGVMWRHKLAAVVPVGFVAVVFLGVVRGGEHDARLAFEVADGEREFRGGAYVVEEIYRKAIGGKHVGCNLGELAAMVAAVVRDGGFQFLAGEAALDIVGKPLSGHADGVFVHAVGADAHDSAQAASAELEAAVKAFVEFFRVLGLHLADSSLCLFIVCSFEPSLYISHSGGIESVLCHGENEFWLCYFGLLTKKREKYCAISGNLK